MAQVDVEAFTLLALALAFIAVRMGVRWRQVGPKNFQLDDYLMPLAGAVFTLETVAAYLVGALFQGLTNSYMTPEQRATLDPNSKEYSNRVWGSKIQVIGWSFYACILWLVKFCLIVFYSRLTVGLNHLAVRIRIGYVLLGVTYAAVALSIIFGCRPIHKYWQINPDPGNICQPTISKLYVYIVVVPNVVTDIYLLAIPLPLLWKVNVTLRKKITLMALFSGAAFVIMAAIIRAVTILKSGPEGAVTGSKWACRETFVSIVVANLPIIQPLLRKAASKIGLSVSSKARGGSRSYPLESREHKSVLERRKNTAPSHPLSVKDTAWGSDEHILTEDDHIGRHKDAIQVTQETVVHSDPWPTNHPSPTPNPMGDWEHQRTNSKSKYNFAIRSGPHGR